MKSVKPYSYLSLIYSYLMKAVDYGFWANYIKEIHETLGNKKDIALELAAGNCSLANYLENYFYKLFVSDISKEMLMSCSNNTLNKICCDMNKLPFKNKFDVIYSAFDSINYLNNEKKLNEHFANMSSYLNEKGIFLFDASLKNNSLKHIKYLNRKGTYKGIKYIQKSIFDPKSKIHTNNIKIKLENGQVLEEVHKQKIYDFYYYFEVLESNGFYVVECFDAFTFNNASEESERVQFIVKRK